MFSSFGPSILHLSGYAPALPTPFRDDGALDLASFEQNCHLQLHAGATALVVCGTTGEAPTLTRSEQVELMRIAVRAACGRIPVIAGAGSNATRHAIELTCDAEAAGADAVLSVVPYYNKPTQAGLYAHFSAIAQATGLPIILYDVPARTVCGLADDTIVRLRAETTQFIGLKDATGDITRPQRLRSRTRIRFSAPLGRRSERARLPVPGRQRLYFGRIERGARPLPGDVPCVPARADHAGQRTWPGDRSAERVAISRVQTRRPSNTL